MAVQEMQKRRLLVLNLTYPVKLAELSYKTVRVDEPAKADNGDSTVYM